MKYSTCRLPIHSSHGSVECPIPEHASAVVEGDLVVGDCVDLPVRPTCNGIQFGYERTYTLPNPSFTIAIKLITHYV